LRASLLSLFRRLPSYTYQVAFTEIPERELREAGEGHTHEGCGDVAFTEIPERELRVYLSFSYSSKLENQGCIHRNPRKGIESPGRKPLSDEFFELWGYIQRNPRKGIESMWW
jgi:hypothetical protein